MFEVETLFRYLQGNIKPELNNRFCFNLLERREDTCFGWVDCIYFLFNEQNVGFIERNGCLNE